MGSPAHTISSSVFATSRLSSVSVVVPVYNSESSLAPLVARLLPTLKDVEHEILLVNDGSRDGSWAAVEAIARQAPSVRGIDLVRNSGQHNATLCGIRAARHSIIVTLDDDLQYRPEDIPRLVQRLDEGADVVYGVPVTGQWGRARNLASLLVKFALRITLGAATAQMVSSFRAFRAPVRDAFARYDSPLTNVDVLLTWGASRFAGVPVEVERRREGRSNYSFYSLFVHSWNMVTGFSTLPLQMATAIGFFFTLFGIGIFSYAIVRWAFFNAVQGFTFLASSIAIFAGAQLFALGVVGEYIGRIFQRTNGQPGYLVRHVTPDPGTDMSAGPGAKVEAQRAKVT